MPRRIERFRTEMIEWPFGVAIASNIELSCTRTFPDSYPHVKSTRLIRITCTRPGSSMAPFKLSNHCADLNSFAGQHAAAHIHAWVRLTA